MEEILHHLGCSKTLKLMGQTTCTNSNLCSISAINSIWLVHRNGKTRTKPKVQLHGPPFFCVFRIFWIIVFCCKSFSGRAWLGRVMSCVSSNVTALLWAIVGRRNFRLLLLWDFLQARPLDTVVASDILIHPVIVRMQFQMCRISMFAARQLRENCTPVGCSDWAQRVCTHTHNERQMTCELFCAIRCDWVSTVFSLSSRLFFRKSSWDKRCQHTTCLVRRSAAHDMSRHDTKPLLLQPFGSDIRIWTATKRLLGDLSAATELCWFGSWTLEHLESMNLSWTLNAKPRQKHLRCCSLLNFLISETVRSAWQWGSVQWSDLSSF